MKLVIQRVKSAKVVRLKDQKTVGKIGQGLFVLVGFKKGDTEEVVNQLTEKLIKLRVMSDQNNKMNLSIKDANAELLIVSQFTLYANSKGGNRPSFIDAEDPNKAKKLYDLFVKKLKSSGTSTEIGSFGDYMIIETDLDGPVTITIEI